MSILVTGGAGYIGSHLVKYLHEKNEDVVVFDNLQRGHKESLPADIKFELVDIRNPDQLRSKMDEYDISSVIHFAAFAYVGESVRQPILYYLNNVIGSINLLNACIDKGITNFVFSSTCSLYGNPGKIPITEDEPVKPINPYAKTKLMIETVLEDYSGTYDFRYAALRYFNAAGCHHSGEIGESHDPEPHLIPIVLQTALGKREKVYIFGNDYNTEDGTCIRDYIHVEDLAAAHYKALNYLKENNSSVIVNLGTGKGYSVKEIIDKCEEITGGKINYEISGRREGDPAVLVAGNNKAKEILNWEPVYDINDIIRSAWEWFSNQKY